MMDRRLILVLVLALLVATQHLPSSAAPTDPSSEAEEDVRVEKASVVMGRTAELPCDITPPSLDSLYLVLWYKNDSDFPIYKYDARRSRESYRQQQSMHDNAMQPHQFHHQQQQHQGSRIHFQFDSHPALLLLSNVDDHDEGIYRCRVDFGRSPTRNVLVHLSVIVPPQKLRIIAAEDNREVSAVIGPYDEGAQLSLNCIVTGGRPRPEVTWWLDDKMVDHTYIGTSENVVQNVIVIQRLERRHLHAKLKCQATNNFPNATTVLPASIQHTHQGQQHRNGQLHPQHTIASSVQLDLNCKSQAVANPHHYHHNHHHHLLLVLTSWALFVD